MKYCKNCGKIVSTEICECGSAETYTRFQSQEELELTPQ